MAPATLPAYNFKPSSQRVLVLEAKTHGGAGVMTGNQKNGNVSGNKKLEAQTESRTEQAEKSEQGMLASEVSYRRLFEAARDASTM